MLSCSPFFSARENKTLKLSDYLSHWHKIERLFEKISRRLRKLFEKFMKILWAQIVVSRFARQSSQSSIVQVRLPLIRCRRVRFVSVGFSERRNSN